MKKSLQSLPDPAFKEYDSFQTQEPLAPQDSIGGFMRISALLATLVFAMNAMADITVYTDRPEARMKVVVENFKAINKNVEVKLVLFKSYAEIKAQLVADGANGTADVVYTNDLVNITELDGEGYLQAMTPNTADVVDASMRDPNNKWTAITYRARTLVYDKTLAAQVAEINTYEDLADPKWAGTLCMRTSNHPYNQALVSGLVANYGYDNAQKIVEGWVANRVEDIYYQNDTAIITAIAQGGVAKSCYLGITNSYYLGLFMIANKLDNSTVPVGIKFLAMKSGGVHTNGTSAGVLATSKQVDQASSFVKSMLTEKTQQFLNNEHQDFPANTSVAKTALTAPWGSFTVDATPWADVGDKVEEAKLLMIDANFK